MRFSILIPARNEEGYIGKCLDSVAAAALPYGDQVQIVVCLNRCSDRTEEIARQYNAEIVHDDAKCLSKIRNTAAGAATGDIITTIDADSVMTRNMLMEIDLALQRDDIVGGGVWIRTERLSLGIALTGLLLMPYLMLYLGISCGCFWCRREDYWAISGFDETMLSAEDVDFAVRLKEHGASMGKRYGTLRRAYITTSCRKFDRFGDWYAIKHIPEMLSLLKGKNRESSDKFWYECER